MYTLSLEEQKTLHQIASFYGCKVRFIPKMNGGMWFGSWIEMDTEFYCKSKAYSMFFHELGHFVNWKTGKYPIFHNPKNFDKMDKIFPDFGKRVRYSLNAEIATEKTGKRLMCEWVQDRRIKYLAYYTNTKVCREFLHGYLLRK